MSNTPERGTSACHRGRIFKKHAQRCFELSKFGSLKLSNFTYFQGLGFLFSSRPPPWRPPPLLRRSRAPYWCPKPLRPSATSPQRHFVPASLRPSATVASVVTSHFHFALFFDPAYDCTLIEFEKDMFFSSPRDLEGELEIAEHIWQCPRTREPENPRSRELDDPRTRGPENPRTREPDCENLWAYIHFEEK